MNKTIVLALLVIFAYSGPLAPSTWTAIAVNAAPIAVVNPVAYWFTVLIAGPVTSLISCFEENTTIATQAGEVLAKNVKIGDLVWTKNHLN